MSSSLRMTNFAFDKLVNYWGFFSKFLSPIIPLHPLVFRVRITNRCNLSCHYCYVGKSLNRKVDSLLNAEEWQKIINSLSSFTLVDITGGEPLLTPGFDEIINSMLDRKLKVSLITNGTIYKEKLFKNFIDKKLSHFMISFDGGEAVHDDVRGKGSFSRAIKSAKKIIELKKARNSKYPLVVAKITYTEKNCHDVENLMNYLLNDIGFSGVTINLLFDNSARDGFADAEELSDQKFWSGNVIRFDAEKAVVMTKILEHLFLRFKGKIQVRPDISVSKVKNYFLNPKDFSPKGCLKYRSVLTMYSDGTLTPCDLGLAVGNVRETNYDAGAIFRHSRINYFFKKFQQEKGTLPGCQGCCLKKHEMTI